MWVKTIGRKLNESLHLLPACHSDVNIFQMYFSPHQFLTAHTWLRTQSATVLERTAFLYWVMLFIKLCRNLVACLSGQSISRSSIMISTMPVRCYLVMFEDRLCCWTSGNVVWNARRFNTSFHWSFSHAHSSFISQKYLALHLITFDCWSNGDRDQFLSVWTWGSYSCIPITTQLL